MIYFLQVRRQTERVNKSKSSKTKKGNSREESTTSALLLLLFFSWKNLKSKNAQVRILGSVRYMWLKTKNYYLKIFVKIRIEIKIYKILFKNWKLLFETIIKHPNWVTSFKLFSVYVWFFTLLVIYILRELTVPSLLRQRWVSLRGLRTAGTTATTTIWKPVEAKAMWRRSLFLLMLLVNFVTPWSGNV